MRFLIAIIEALIGIVQRNPLTVIIVIILAMVAPALLKGIALFVLYLFLGFIALALIMLFVVRWRMVKVAQQMSDQFGQGGQSGDFRAGPAPEQQHEGDMKVYKTSETPEKRVSKSVGDYVEFEEEKN